ncbi:hypothetical protein BJ165DRAFT_1581048 [Panaeolus papilionaceus]|nr:hypothetical protein BJ165DRAFT_1581048 [Panaeolus papilionaceus]
MRCAVAGYVGQAIHLVLWRLMVMLTSDARSDRIAPRTDERATYLDSGELWLGQVDWDKRYEVRVINGGTEGQNDAKYGARRTRTEADVDDNDTGQLAMIQTKTGTDWEENR